MATQLPWILTALGLATAGFLLGWRLRDRRGDGPPRDPPRVPTGATADERAARRAASLDALAEAVLITDRDGLVLDCNSSALALVDRHRGAVQDQYAKALRHFAGVEEEDARRAAAEDAVWVGDAWAHQPDGAMRLCHARVVAIRDERARITGFAESFRDVALDRGDEEEWRDLLFGVRVLENASATPTESLDALRDDLRLLSESFRDLDHVLRHYERLLPSLSASDPLAESIAGLAHEARAAAAAAGLPMLLDEIPRALARARGHLQALAREVRSRPGDPGTRDAEPDPDDGRPNGARRD